MNVLSIDFNYFLHDYMNIYADKISLEDNITQQWNKILFASNLENVLNIDYVSLNKAMRFLLQKVASSDTKFYYGLYNNEICSILYDNTINKDSNQLTLYTIDFFDDVSTTSDDASKVKDFNVYNERNWIDYLNKHYELKYTWIKSSSSLQYQSYVDREMNIMSLDQFINICEPINFDIIFVCFSPRYVHAKFYNLFRLFVESLSDVNHMFFIENGAVEDDDTCTEIQNDITAEDIYKEVIEDEYNVGT